jgi:Tfp pilus assembly protein PilN
MVTINLLPWREKQAQFEKRELLKILGVGLLGAALLILGGDRYIASQQQATQDRIEKLKKEIIWRQGLKNVSQLKGAGLATQHNDALELFRRLNDVPSSEVCFEQVKKSKQGVELIGMTSSAEQLTQFLQATTMASYFSELKITQLQQQDSQHVKFRLFGKLNAL